MSLLYIINIDNLNQTFTIAICFLNQKTKEYYNKAILQFCQLFEPNIYLSILAIDCEIALISAFERYFSIIRTKVVLCFWYILKNVTFYYKSKFEMQDRWEAFIKGFCEVIQAKTEDEFQNILEEQKADFYWNNSVLYTVENPALTIVVRIQELADFDLERQTLAYYIGQ